MAHISPCRLDATPRLVEVGSAFAATSNLAFANQLGALGAGIMATLSSPEAFGLTEVTSKASGFSSEIVDLNSKERTIKQDGWRTQFGK